MKLIININEKAYKNIARIPGIDWNGNLLRIVNDALQNGTPIHDNATNGEVIRTMFPNTEIMITDEKVFLREETIVMIYPLTWWNAPYQKGGKE